MIMHKITVDDEKCIGCGSCVKDCLQNNIFLNEEKKARIKSQVCLKCGHCSAICPEEAVSISGYSQAPYEIDDSFEGLDPHILLDSIRYRRSIRQFKDKKVEMEKLDMIIEAGRWSPTARNNQGVSYVILDKDKEKVESMAVDVFRNKIEKGELFNNSYKNFNVDKNFFFKGAALAIVIMAENDIDGALAASNMALMAESLDLGVLYSGFFAYATKLSKELREELGFLDKKLVTCLVIGYPNVEYRRSAQRKDAVLTYR